MIEEYNYLWFVIVGIWNFLTSTWILSIPIALFIMYHSLRFIGKIFMILKQKGG